MDKAKKKQVKKIVTWALMAAIVAGLAAMPLLAKNKTEADGPVASVLSGKVEEGSISTVIRGGGTLSVEDVENIRIPTGVKITEFLVKNGDRVTEGTPLAAVDKVSVMTAITSVTDTLEYLQDEIRDAKEEKVDSTISATAGGRVKKVYAAQGDSVQKVMLQHGALALLSLDGLMAVNIERKMDLPTGQSVEVMLSDKTVVTGRVDSNLSGEIVVTIEDEGYEIGETVTVFTNDSERVGSGQLYVHNAWTATAYSGTIQTVYAKEETKVTSGSTLLTLTDTSFQGELQYLSALHREYEELLQDLFTMYNSGTIDTPCTGMVSGVDKDSTHLLADDGEGDAHVELLTAQDAEWSLVLLSAEDCGTENCTRKGDHTVDSCPKNVCTFDLDCAANPDKHDLKCIFSCSKSNVCNGTGLHYSDCIKSCNYDSATQTCPGTLYHKNDCILSCVHASVKNGCGSKDENDPHYLDCIYSCQKSDGTRDCPSLKHWPECIESCTHADTLDACIATGKHYTDCIGCCISSESKNDPCPSSKHKTNCFFYGMTYKARIAKVTAVGSSQLVVRWDASGKYYDVLKTGSGWVLAPGSNFSTDLLVNEGTLSISNPGAFQPGDVILVISGYRGENVEWSGVELYSRGTPGTGNMPGGFGDLAGMLSSMMSGMLGNFGNMGFLGSMAGMGGYGAASSSPVDSEALFDLNGSVLLTVSPETTATLTVTLDEQDIAKVFAGQKATVKVEALGKERFDAEVVEISNHGQNNGGNSKFSVKLRFAQTHDMIDGMSTTAILELDTLENIPVIPVAALAEDGSKTVVYTALDEKTGEPSNPVEVTLGVSDEESVQILSGLSLGDAYYYSYYDTLELDTSVESA